MRMKCPECKAKIDRKSQYCEFCGHEFVKTEKNNIKNNESEEVVFINNNDKNEPTNKTAFITCGETFFVGKATCVLGIAVQKIKVGDCLIFNNQRLKVQKIDKFRATNLDSVEEGNCVLHFNIEEKQLFKHDLLVACEKYAPYHKPINFSRTPTSKYVFIDLE